MRMTQVASARRSEGRCAVIRWLPPDLDEYIKIKEATPPTVGELRGCSASSRYGLELRDRSGSHIVSGVRGIDAHRRCPYSRNGVWLSKTQLVEVPSRGDR